MDGVQPCWTESTEAHGAPKANFIWNNFGEESGSPVWDAVGEGPAQGTTVAAWLEDGVVYLIAP